MTEPYFAYKHADEVVAGESCPVGSSSISGLAFYSGDAFPAAYKDALFFADFSRKCIWVMYKGADGLPDPATRQTFMSDAAGPVFLTEGPDGALYYADLEGGTIRRIASDSSAPTARIAANPTTGAAPLDVAFDGRGSSDPEGDTLTYAWDLDGDGDFNDSTAATANFTYAKPGAVTVRLRVSDPNGRHGTASTVITAGGPPTVTVTAPSAANTWAVGDTISFSGSARNSAGEALAAKDLVWSLSMRHCPSNCHTHPIENYVGVTSGSLVAPDHEFPSHLLLSLTATDSAGLSATETVRLDPRTANIALNSSPPGLALSFASETLTTPATRTVIARSETTVSAPSSQLLGAARYLWRAWNDGLAQSHEITAPASGTASYTATYAPETSVTPESGAHRHAPGPGHARAERHARPGHADARAEAGRADRPGASTRAARAAASAARSTSTVATA